MSGPTIRLANHNYLHVETGLAVQFIVKDAQTFGSKTEAICSANEVGKLKVLAPDSVFGSVISGSLDAAERIPAAMQVSPEAMRERYESLRSHGASPEKAMSTLDG